MNHQPEATPQQFWDHVHAKDDPYARTGHLAPDVAAALDAAAAHCGPLQSKRLLDLGCGNGAAAIWFARRGAEVTAVDMSPVAIEKLQDFARRSHLSNLHPVCCSALTLAALGRVDYVFGSMILHHLEPFAEVAAALSAVAPRGFFYENSANSRALIWCRRHLVGRYGIPKVGDHDEFPLEQREVALLRRHFVVRQYIPEMVFLGLISGYLLRGHAAAPLRALDRCLYRTCLRRLSYSQYLYLDQVEQGGDQAPG